jgi:hypothetical protein
MDVSIKELGFPALYVFVKKANVVNPTGIYTEHDIGNTVAPNTTFVTLAVAFIPESK